MMTTRRVLKRCGSSWNHILVLINNLSKDKLLTTLNILSQELDSISITWVLIKQVHLQSEIDWLNHGMILNNIMRVKIPREYIIYLLNSLWVDHSKMLLLTLILRDHLEMLLWILVMTLKSSMSKNKTLL